MPRETPLSDDFVIEQRSFETLVMQNTRTHARPVLSVFLSRKPPIRKQDCTFTVQVRHLRGIQTPPLQGDQHKYVSSLFRENCPQKKNVFVLYRYDVFEYPNPSSARKPTHIRGGLFSTKVANQKKICTCTVQVRHLRGTHNPSSARKPTDIFCVPLSSPSQRVHSLFLL